MTDFCGFPSGRGGWVFCIGPNSNPPDTAPRRQPTIDRRNNTRAVSALGQLGRKEETEGAIKRATIAIAPMSFDDYARRQYPADSDEKQAHYLEGMRKAGWQS